MVSGPNEETLGQLPSSASAAPRAVGRSWREFVKLAAVAIAIPLFWWIVWTVVRGGNTFNDFHDFYLAAKMVTLGESPYDKQALVALAHSEGLSFVVGTGYSYPLPFALAMIPFTVLPFDAAVLAFSGLGLALFGLTVGAWIGWAHGWTPEFAPRRLRLAAAAGLYPSVYGTIANGQANLLLLPLLGLGTMALVDGKARRGLGGGLAVGLAAIVKLTPGAIVVPLVLGRRLASAAGVLLGAVGALAIATLVAPFAGEGSGGLSALLDPDSYFTNQSINGFVSRLVLHSERTRPIWDHAFDARAVTLLLTAGFALATIAILWQARHALEGRRGLALGMGFALVAALIGAPKGTYWNQALVLVPAGLLLAVEVPDLRFGRLPRLDLLLLGGWIAGTWVQTLLWLFPPGKSLGSAEMITFLTSSSVYGLLALWLVFARRLLATPILRISSGLASAAGAPQALQ